MDRACSLELVCIRLVIRGEGALSLSMRRLFSRAVADRRGRARTYAQTPARRATRQTSAAQEGRMLTPRFLFLLRSFSPTQASEYFEASQYAHRFLVVDPRSASALELLLQAQYM